MFNNKLDIWSLGCILYELCFGRKAFKSDFETLEFARTPAKKAIELPDWPKYQYRRPLNFWINRMLVSDPEERPSADTLCQLLANFLYLLGSRDSIQILNDPTALIQAENVIGTDVYMRHGLLRWEEVFAPGNFEQHQGCYATV